MYVYLYLIKLLTHLHMKAPEIRIDQAICSLTRTYICIYACMYIHIYTYIYIHIYIYMYTHVFMSYQITHPPQ